MVFPPTRELYWEDLMSECMKKQQLSQLKLVHDLENLSLQNIGSVNVNTEYVSISFTKPSTGFQLQSFLESIQFGNSSNDTNLGCGLGPICQSNVSSAKKSEKLPSSDECDEVSNVVKLSETRLTERRKIISMPTSRVEEAKIAGSSIVSYVETRQDTEYIEVGIDEEFHPQRDDEEALPVLSTNKETVIVFSEKVTQPQTPLEKLEVDELSTTPVVTQGDIDFHQSAASSETPVPVENVFDRIGEKIQSSQLDMEDFSRYLSDNPCPSLVRDSSRVDRSHERIKFEDFPPLNFPKLPLISSESMQVMRLQINKAVESLSTIQRQLRIRKQFVSAKAAKVHTMETEYNEWIKSVASKTNSLCLLLSQAVEELRNLMKNESIKENGIQVRNIFEWTLSVFYLILHPFRLTM